MFKAITGGDVIQGERKLRDAFEFRPFAKLISANQMPSSEDPIYSLYRRWVIVPFANRYCLKSALFRHYPPQAQEA
jgi:phage/plasmid-associated DNA primase